MTRFELTDECIDFASEQYGAVKLHRIRIIEDHRRAKAGTLGGFVYKKENIKDDGIVLGDAIIADDAVIKGTVLEHARVFGEALVEKDAVVKGYACVHDNACIIDSAMVTDHARIYENAKVSGEACVFNYATAYMNAMIMDRARICGNARIKGTAIVCDYAYIGDNTTIQKNSFIMGNSIIMGECVVSGSTLNNVNIRNKQLLTGGSWNTTPTIIYFDFGEVGFYDNETIHYNDFAMKIDEWEELLIDYSRKSNMSEKEFNVVHMAIQTVLTIEKFITNEENL